MKPWQIYLTAVAIAGPIIGGIWAMGDAYGFRPALKAEVDDIRANMVIMAGNMAWIQLQNYENYLKRGGKLSPRECSKYRKLARSLGVQPRPC